MRNVIITLALLLLVCGMAHAQCGRFAYNPITGQLDCVGSGSGSSTSPIVATFNTATPFCTTSPSVACTASAAGGASGNPAIAVTHGYNMVEVGVWCYDSQGTPLVLGGFGSSANAYQIAATSVNITTVTFSAALAGTCKFTTGGLGPAVSIGGTNGQIQYNNSGSLAGFTPGGDVTFSNPNFTVVKVHGVSYPTTGSSFDALPILTASNTIGYYQINGGASCGDSTHAMSYDATTHLFGCQAIAGGGSPGGTNGQIQYNNSSAFGGFTPGGDVTFSNPNFTVAKVNGVSYPTTGALFDAIPILTASNTVGYYQINAGSSCGDASHALSYNASTHLLGCQAISAAVGSVSLDAITAAGAGNTIGSGDFAQVWNWTLTTSSKSAFTFGETSASAASGTPILVNIKTLATSTVNPFQVTAGGTANGIQVNTSGILSKIGSGQVNADHYNSNAVVAVADGGTGAGTFTTHGVLMGKGTSSFGVSTAGNSGAPFLSGGSSADGAYGALNLAGGTNIVTGVLPLANVGRVITFVVDNNGSAITAGGPYYIGQIAGSCTIYGWSLVADVSGSISIDVDAHANATQGTAPATPDNTTDKISGSSPMVLTSALSNASSSPSWAAGLTRTIWDSMGITITGTPTSVTKVTGQIFCQ